MLVYKCIHGLAPLTLQTLIHFKCANSLTLVTDYFPATNIGRRAFSFYAPRQWNALPFLVRQAHNLTSFKSGLKTYLFSNYQIFCQNYNKYAMLTFAWSYNFSVFFLVFLSGLIFPVTFFSLKRSCPAQQCCWPLLRYINIIYYYYYY